MLRNQFLGKVIIEIADLHGVNYRSAGDEEQALGNCVRILTAVP